jgi:hypothetical protein
MFIDLSFVAVTPQDVPHATAANRRSVLGNNQKLNEDLFVAAPTNQHSQEIAEPFKQLSHFNSMLLVRVSATVLEHLNHVVP